MSRPAAAQAAAAPWVRQAEGVLLIAAHPELDRHDTGRGHPERPGRMAAAVAALRAPEIAEALEWLPVRTASRSELVTVHDPAYLDGIAAMAASGGGALDPDTVLSTGSWDTALITAGAGLSAVEALQAGRGDAAFVVGRPPGHHAERDRGMGFCLVNNIAVAAAALRARGERVAIVDWDVHHGNGTQDVFWTDPNVLFVSVHQSPLYPGTGGWDERGGGVGLGTTINLPLPPGAAGDAYLALFDEVVVPAVERFAPTWVLVSAGYDAHRADPLAQMELTSGDYADLTRRSAALAPQAGRVVLFLEGGYDLVALRDSVFASASALLGGNARPEPGSSGGTGRERVPAYRELFIDEPLPG
ncbi:MAG: histone deacetylase [Acidimicrobiaceae bacterium]|nr:histone deacetylase [Acidimicrobiaceae bacterium]